MLKLGILNKLKQHNQNFLKAAKFALPIIFVLLGAVLSGSSIYLSNRISPDSKALPGQIEIFNIDNKKLHDRIIKAELVSQTSVANFWVDVKNPIIDGDVDALSINFSEKIYPNNLKYFAGKQTAQNVGKVNILITDIENTDGYFSASDLRAGHQSNLIFLNSSIASDERSEATVTLAHEFAHLLYYLNGAPENELLDEALAVYAESINGKYPYYAQRTDYGQAFSFLEKATKAIASSGGSVQSFTRSLASGSNTTGIKTTLKKYISKADLDALGELVDDNAQREVSLTSAFLRFAR